VRWFDNNTFYRKPVITEKVAFRGTNLQGYFRSDLLPRSCHKRAILPGPFTFAVLSDNKFYSSVRDLADDLAHALKEVVRRLQGLGYDYFQFNDPCLCDTKRSDSDFSIAKHAYETCSQAKSMVHTYFGDAARVIESLLDLPVDALGVDLYSTSMETLRDHEFNKILGCGCVDGRNSLLESPADLKELTRRIRDELNPPEIHLTPNCDLEFLPRSVAARKVALLGETQKLLA
jgi:5-methyltetrahydropteroyltriglutamate--homocysteine methyltransferase